MHAFGIPRFRRTKLAQRSGAVNRLLYLAGQSNNLSTGATTLPPAIAAINSPRVQIWDNSSAFHQYVPGTNSEPTGVLPTVFGPEAEYARQWLIDHPVGTLYIVKGAVGSTGISYWVPTTGSKYALMTGYVSPAKAALAAAGVTLDEIYGIFWDGESDANVDQNTANAFKAKLLSSVAGQRTDWGNAATKIALVRIYTTDMPYGATVRAAQNDVAYLDPLTYLINNDDSVLVDPYHDDSASIVTIGARCYSAHKNGTSIEVSDTTPDAFAFVDQPNAGASTVYTSAITVTGITAAATISVSGTGSYKINGGSYTTSTGTVVNGDVVTVQDTSGPTNADVRNTVVTIGGVSDTFTLTTVTSYTFTNSEASALVTRMDALSGATPKTNSEKGQIDTFVGACKTAGIWTKMDGVYVFGGAQSAAEAKLNWLSTGYPLTASATAPTFASATGFTGNGTSSYLDTAFNPTTAPSPNLTQNSGHMGAWTVGAAILSDTGFDIGQFTGNACAVNSNRASGAVSGVGEQRGRISAAANVSALPGSFGAGPPTGVGHNAISRSASTGQSHYRNNVAASTNPIANTSAAIANDTVAICRGSSGYSARPIVAAHFGAGLTSTEMSALYNALYTLLHARTVV